MTNELGKATDSLGNRIPRRFRMTLAMVFLSLCTACSGIQDPCADPTIPKPDKCYDIPPTHSRITLPSPTPPPVTIESREKMNIPVYEGSIRQGQGIIEVALSVLPEEIKNSPSGTVFYVAVLSNNEVRVYYLHELWWKQIPPVSPGDRICVSESQQAAVDGCQGLR